LTLGSCALGQFRLQNLHRAGPGFVVGLTHGWRF
jgi:hypothetical protein